jgi:phage shock protein PspC (stress-responsive transcriptional regulator)
MGQPSDFAPEEEARSSEAYVRYQKRLYRDPENKIIGGVCSGIGAYFNLDPIWVRLIFILLMLAPGFGLLLYIILWLVVPEARTKAEKLEMSGHPVTISSLERSIRSEATDVKEKMNEMAGKAKEKFHRTKKDVSQGDYSYTKDNLRSIGNFFLRVLAILSGIIIFLMAASLSLLFIFIVFRYPGITIAEHVELGFFPLFPFLSMLFENDADLRTFGIGVLILIAIPLLLLMLAGIRLVFKIPTIRYFNGAAGWVWLLTLIITVIFGLKVAASFRNETESVRQQVIEIPSGDTLSLELTSNLPAGTDWEYQRSYQVPEWGIYLTDFNNVIYGIPQLRIIKSPDSSVYLKERYYARGSTRSEAMEHAEAITYDWSLDGSLLKFPESYTLAANEKWRNQELIMELKLPEGYVFKTDGKISKIITRMRGLSKYKMDDSILQMTEEGVHEFVP